MMTPLNKEYDIWSKDAYQNLVKSQKTSGVQLNAQWLRASNYFDKFVSQYLSGARSCPAGSSPAGSISQELNSQKLRYQYLTTGIAVALAVSWYFNG